MADELSILFIEDQALDAELCEHELRRSGLTFTSERVCTRAALGCRLPLFWLFEGRTAIGRSVGPVGVGRQSPHQRSRWAGAGAPETAGGSFGIELRLRGRGWEARADCFT